VILLYSRVFHCDDRSYIYGVIHTVLGT